MRERELFLAALEIEDPAARQAHLKVECADDAELLARVESLLTSHEGQSQFLHTPVVEQIAEVSDAGNAATILAGISSTQDDEPDATALHSHGPNAMTANRDDLDDEIPLGYLEPSSKPGSQGRLGHYEVLEVIGRGAFGTVLRAFDEKLHRVVAIKVMSPEMAATSPARKRFVREAQSSAAIRHEHVVSVYAVEEKPIPYLVMEFIPGLTLQQRLDQSGPLDVPTVLRIGRQIAEGLAAAHAQDLIHRDIKPANILLETGAREMVKVTDFGLTRAADDASLTQSGTIAGTPMYMAPEQAAGHKLDQRADLFSFGSVLYQMVSGRPPFRANGTLAVLKRLAEDTPRPIREIIPEAPQWLCDIITKLHAKNPDQRYQSAREIADVLANCESQLKAHAGLKDFSLIPQAKSPPTSLWKWVAVAVLVCPLLGFGLFALTRPAAPLKVAENGTIKPPTTDPITSESDPSSVVTAPEKTPPPAIAPFDAAQARVHQQAWADYLGVPVEKEITLGRNQRGVDVKLTMILIPPGEFLMGSSEDEIGRLREQAPASGLRVEDLDKINLEGPQRRVRITKPFYLSKHEITTAQFRSFAQAQPGEYLTEPEKSGKGAWIVKVGPSERDPEFNWKRAAKKGPQGPDSPVVNVTWNDANDCCAWLSQLDAGLTFGLPTEAQWEYACRAGSATLWSTGDEESSLENHAVIKANWQKDIGDRLPNAFGLCDMHGNVWEWCQDAFYDYRNAQNVDPIGAVSGEWRIIRGGSSFDGTGYSKNWSENNGCRSAVRETRRPGNPLFAVGFRAAAAISDEVIQAAIDRKTSDAPSPEAKTPPPAIAPFSDADVQRIVSQPAAEQVEEVRKELMKRNPGFDGKVQHKIEDGIVTEIKVATDHVTDIAPLRVFNSLKVLDLGATETNYRGKGQLADLSPLRGMNFSGLTKLNLDWTKVTDAGLVHFQGCKELTNLRLFYNPVSDAGLVHFKDCKKLTSLHLASTNVSDAGLGYFRDCTNLMGLYMHGSRQVSEAGLAHFKDCKNLTVLFISFTSIRDLSLLKNWRLKHLLCSFQADRDAEILRSITTLETINGKPAAEFWKDVDQQ